MSYFSRTPTEKLSDYLSRIHSRLRVNAASRGFGATALVALLLTVICVYIANRFAFSDSSVVSTRTLLFGSVIAIVIFALLRPLLKIGRRSAADHAEKRVPAFEGRVETFFDQTREESGKKPSPFLDLLAEDTMRVAESAPVQFVVDAKRMLGYALAAAVAIGVLMWMGTSGPGYWGYGTARLWGGWLKPSVSPLYQIVVEPGDTTIRQGADLIIKAQMVGFESPTAQLFAKFDSGVQWEEAPMQREVEGTGFEFLFAGVREPLHYYIAAGGIQSEEFEVQVVEMPNVESIKLTYHYPSWTGLEDTIEEDLGDIRAVAGTEVEVEVKTDKPLTDGVLRLNEESSVSMSGDGLTSVGRLKVAEEGYYFVAALYQGEIVRLTNDYFITVVPDEEPTVRFLSPGRDAKATNIEEVFTQFEASDDFGLRSFEVHYSVNGSEVEKVRLPVNGKDSTASHTFYLEEMSASDWPDRPSGAEASDVPDRLQPGDIISYYGIARDAKTSTQTDMYFIEVRPFEYEFVQGQAGGGMSGGGQQQEEISKRQREIIAGTWNLIKDSDGADKRTRQEIRDNALLLSEVQLTLRDQARTLAERVRARQLAGTNEDFKAFVENMEKAAEQMAPAAEKLKGQQLRDALSPEQKALQYLRRAESIFRRIQVAFGSRGGGGGGGQASRDLLEMFELEMDLEKNQYETGGGASSQQLEREIDEALEKLKELARRQEKLADQIRREPTPTFSQRWQQEILRREAEELKRQMEELQQRQAAQQQSGQQQGGQQQSGQQQGGQQSGQRAGMEGAGGSRLQQTIRRLEQASRDMDRAARTGGRPQDNLGQRQAQARSQRAQERLQEAVRSLEEQRRQETSAALSDMARRAERLAQEQQETSQTLQKSLDHAIDYIKEHGGQARGRIPSGLSPREELGLSDRKKEMQQEVESIERQMQQAARQLRNSQTSRKLREALSDMRDAELGMRLRQEAAYIRQGYAYYAAQRQGAVTEAIKRLRDQLREAERLAQSEGGGDERGLERTLARLEELRRRLEDSAGLNRRRDPNQPGGQPGQQGRQSPGGQNQNGDQQGPGQSQQQAQQQGQGQGQQQGQGRGQGQQQGQQQAQGQGQGQGQQPGQQPGQGQPNSRGQLGPGGQQRSQMAGGGGGPHGWRGGEQDWGSASNFGGWRGPVGTQNLDPETRRRMEQAMRESERAVPALTRQLRGYGFSDEELAEIRRFVAGLSDENFPGNPNLLQEEHRKLLSLLEQLELQVRRQVEEDQGGTQVRATATEPVPEQYREAVAEYFRRLSQGR